MDKTRLGSAISGKEKTELDYILEKTGLMSYKVSSDLGFNGAFEGEGDADAPKLKALIKKYSKRGYIFAHDGTPLIGNIAPISFRLSGCESNHTNESHGD